MTVEATGAPVEVVTLTDGGQPAATTADRAVAFLGAARRSIDLAIYDVHLSPTLAERVRAALREARLRGVVVRFLCNEAMPHPTDGPPAARTDLMIVDGLGIPSVHFSGVPDLMHHKYVVRDGRDVWTGSTNWSDDSWSREENVLVTVASADLAAAYAEDFEQLWRSGDVSHAGRVSPRPVTVGPASIRAWFSPGHARSLVHRIADAIGHARRRVRIASPVITSGPILGTLTEVAEDGRVDVGVVVDATQVHEVLGQWAARKGWKRAMLERIVHDPRTHGKRSTPWRPDSVHDFMHAKVTVADDTVFVGSYNLSRSGESNAEDVLEIEDSDIADRLATYVDELCTRYPAFA